MYLKTNNKVKNKYYMVKFSTLIRLTLTLPYYITKLIMHIFRGEETFRMVGHLFDKQRDNLDYIWFESFDDEKLHFWASKKNSLKKSTIFNDFCWWPYRHPCKINYAHPQIFSGGGGMQDKVA